jgi:hypothetical protein
VATAIVTTQPELAPLTGVLIVPVKAGVTNIAPIVAQAVSLIIGNLIYETRHRREKREHQQCGPVAKLHPRRWRV